MRDILVKIENMSFSLGGVSILENINMTINKGDFITIIGPNGAGKSMLLKSILGLIPPTFGTINKQDGIKIGYIPQRFVPDKTLPINVKYFLRLGMVHDKEFYNKIIEKTSISQLLDKQLSHLSGGELQRILLARSLLQKPDILIFDEPAQNLDITGQIHFYDYIKQLYEEQNITILMVSHDLHLVMRCTKYVICLYKHICCEGTAADITSEPEFLSIFGNDLSKIMSLYHHHHNHIH